MSEPTLTDIATQLNQVVERLDKLSTDVESIKLETKDIKQAIDKLDNRIFELSMRIVTTNQSAFWSVSVAILAAVIAFVVTRISEGTRL